MAVIFETERLEGGKAVLRIAGRLDAAATADFEAALVPLAEDAELGLIVLDCERLDYVASAGLRVLLKAVKAVDARKAALRGARVDAKIVSVLKMTGFLAYIDIKPTLEDALA